MSNAKPWWQSKTVWAGGITFFIGVLGLANEQFFVENPQVAGIILTVVGVLGIILRRLTEKPIK